MRFTLKNSQNASLNIIKFTWVASYPICYPKEFDGWNFYLARFPLDSTSLLEEREEVFLNSHANPPQVKTNLIICFRLDKSLCER